MFSKVKMKNGLLGGSRVKSQKGGEKLIDVVEGNFYKGLMACESMWRLACESMWRLLVFCVLHIH